MTCLSVLCWRSVNKVTKTVFTRRQSAYFESWFEMRMLNHDSKYSILDRVYAKSRRDSWFEMRISNHSPEVFSSYASLITNLDVIWRTHGPKYRISNRDSRCASRITIQNTHFAVVWKQSKLLKASVDGGANWAGLCPSFSYFPTTESSQLLKGKILYAHTQVHCPFKW